jgi:hypothetical protein
MYDSCVADSTWWAENMGGSPSVLGCSATDDVCPCVVWLRHHADRADEAVEAVIRHLCDMRHSMVHESWPVFMVAEGGSGFPSSIRDLYPCGFDPEMFRSYESGITLDRFKAIVITTARNYLNAAYPLIQGPVTR